MSQEWVCPKCGFKKRTKTETVRLESKYEMNIFLATACICDNCGYIELYKQKY